jgi:hypothetical protein
MTNDQAPITKQIQMINGEMFKTVGSRVLVIHELEVGACLVIVHWCLVIPNSGTKFGPG